jgi:RNA polymerase sigma-70 factor, ECF subfamily
MHARLTNRKHSLLEVDQLPTDRQLALLVMQGDQAAVRELVDRHQGIVLRLCVRMMGCRHDAEDVVQETFVRAVRSMARWDASRPLEPWLLAIAANRCRTALGKRRDLLFDQQSMAESYASKGSDDLPGGDLGEEVERALGEIRDEYRQAFCLFHTDELAYAEIAEVLDVPLGTVKTWVHRARKELATILRRRGVVETLTRQEEENELPTSRSATAAVAG